MIVRISGERTGDVLVALGVGDSGGATARRVDLGFAGVSVPAWVYRFRRPHSYTGEDVAELHIPGNPLLARMLLDELVRLGCRRAEAGEFSARAFFNGRMDLTEAEGVAATIAAHGQSELLAARQLLSGELARRLRPMMQQLAEALALVETGIDFSEEDVTFIASEELGRRMNEIAAALADLACQSVRFERLEHEPRFVLVGRPNAGKSTLLNALAGTQRAVVSPIAGTTRDVLSAEVALDRGMVHVMDAAGLEEHSPPAGDTSPLAQIAHRMHEQAMAAVEASDFVVLVRDAADARAPLKPGRDPDLIVWTKIDLAGASSDVPGGLAVSALTGQNMDGLRRRLSELAFGSLGAQSASLALNARHLEAIDDARSALARAAQAAPDAGAEIIAMELREALDALGRVLGQITPDDVLSRVFARFCIGK